MSEQGVEVNKIGQTPPFRFPAVPAWAVDAATVFLIAVFGFAGTSKLLVQDASWWDFLVGFAEIGLAVWIFTGFHYRACSIVTVGVAILFMVVNIWTWATGASQHCSCYGLFAFPWSVSLLNNLIILAAAVVRLAAGHDSDDRRALLGIASVGLVIASYFILVIFFPAWRPATEGDLVDQPLPAELLNYVLDEEMSRDFVLIITNCHCSKCVDNQTRINNRAVRMNNEIYSGRRAHARIVHFCDFGVPPVSSIDGSETYQHIVTAVLPRTTAVKRIPTPSVMFLDKGIVTRFLAGNEFDEWLEDKE